MTMHMPNQTPIRIPTARKTDMRAQFAALVYRLNGGKIEVLLITSRKTRRWVIPKGWPMSGRTPAEAAAREAWEEAGARGTTHSQSVGQYTYLKKISTRGGRRKVPVIVSVFPVEAPALAAKFPEAGQRKRKWFSRKKAAKRINEPELAQLIRNFDPRHMR